MLKCTVYLLNKNNLNFNLNIFKYYFEISYKKIKDSSIYNIVFSKITI